MSTENGRRVQWPRKRTPGVRILLRQDSSTKQTIKRLQWHSSITFCQYSKILPSIYINIYHLKFNETMLKLGIRRIIQEFCCQILRSSTVNSCKNYRRIPPMKGYLPHINHSVTMDTPTKNKYSQIETNKYSHASNQNSVSKPIWETWKWNAINCVLGCNCVCCKSTTSSIHKTTGSVLNTESRDSNRMRLREFLCFPQNKFS